MSFLASNRAILEERFGAVDSLFSESTDKEETPRWEIQESRNGLPWATVEGKSLCSRHDPQREARRLIERENSSINCACMMGLGLAYTAEAWAESYPESTLIIIESRKSNFRQALALRNLSTLLRHPRLYLLVENRPEDFTELLKELQLTGLQLFKHRTMVPLYLPEYKAMEESLNLWLQRKHVNRNTLKRFGKLWIRNFSANLPLLPQAGSLEQLKGLFEGFSALLLAAGPSLEEQLPRLKAAAERAVIISVDTAYRSLKRIGVEPHFLLITDPQYWNSRHLDFCISGGIMVSDSSTHPRVFRNHHGPLYLSASPFPLAKAFEEPGFSQKLRSGGSVATAAWDLAQLLGCSSVYMAGLDLGYPGKQTHCRGSYFEERSLYLGQRLSGVENLSFQVLHSAPLKRYPGVKEGEQVLTDQRMEIYISWFQEMCRQKSIPTLNLSGKGVRIHGMEKGNIETLLKSPARVEEIEMRMNQASQVHGVVTPEELERRLLDSVEDLSVSLELAERGTRLSRDLQQAFRQGKDLAALISRLDEVDQELSRHRSGESAGFLIEPFLEELNSQQGLKDPEAIMENSLNLYSRMAESIGFHKEALEGATELLNGVLKANQE